MLSVFAQYYPLLSYSMCYFTLLSIILLLSITIFHLFWSTLIIYPLLIPFHLLLIILCSILHLPKVIYDNNLLCLKHYLQFLSNTDWFLSVYVIYHNLTIFYPLYITILHCLLTIILFYIKYQMTIFFSFKFPSVLSFLFLSSSYNLSLFSIIFNFFWFIS